MRSAYCFIASLCCIIVTSSSKPTWPRHGSKAADLPASTNALEKAMKFLVKYGYLATNDGPTTPKKLRHAMAVFQHSYGLKSTGLLDHETLDLMEKPRCGVPDLNTRPASKIMSPFQTRHRSYKNHSILSDWSRGLRVKRYVLFSKWPSRKISYGFRNYASSLPVAEQKSAISHALKVWSRDTPLSFSQVRGDEGDVVLSFERRFHNDGYPFDGSGHTLAHAFFPGQGSKSGDIHFDEDETWRYTKPNEGTNLFTVAVHEIGHALGLGHSTSEGSVMRPFYNGFKSDVRLGADDINAINDLYGGVGLLHGYLSDGTSSSVVDDPLPAATTGVLTGGRKESITSTPPTCNYQFDAAADIRGGIYFFKGNYFWRIARDGQIFSEIRMGRFWSDFPVDVNVDAVYARKENIFIFSGTRYWAYTHTKTNSSYPRPISDFGLPMDSGIDAAFVWSRNGETYFFKGSQYWLYNENKRRVELSYPRYIRDYIRGIPDNIDGAFTDPVEKNVYFIKGQKSWKMDKSIRVMESDSIGVNWFGCPKPENELQPEIWVNSTSQTSTTSGQGIGLRCKIWLLASCILACFAKNAFGSLHSVST